MRLTVVGCSGSVPGPASPASCYLVEHEGFRLVLDLGNGALGVLQRHVPGAAVDAVLITHLHGDHCLDLCALYVARRYGRDSGGPARVPVLGPAGTAERTADAYGGGASVADLARVMAFEVVGPGCFEVGPFQVTAVRAAHPVECLALRLDAGGRSLVYTGDTGPSEAVTALATGADLLLAEASFVDGDVNPPGLHLTGRQAGRMARDAGVGRLLVTHVPPWHDAAVALAEARTEFDGPSGLAEPDAVLEV